jgi:apolipoprotein N-acyltransferase
MNEYQTHLGTIYRRDTKTLYVRWGNWLNWTLAGLAVVMIAFTGIRRDRAF